MSHESYMHRCLQLARLGLGHVAPNPMVGAVLVHNDLIIGEGYHQQYGQAHAEVNCFDQVAAEHRNKIADSTLYVSLEPCAHFGKTPPCAHKIVEMGVKRVVVGCTDSFDAVNGKGIEFLKSKGIEVILPVLEEECKEINKHFFTSIAEQRPYITLKWAQSADGFISKNGHQTKISSLETDIWVHQQRASHQAIMVGTNTVLIDNPSLTVRHVKGSNPLRIVLDKNLRLPPHVNIFDDAASTVVINSKVAKANNHVTYLKIDEADFLLETILKTLHQQHIQSILVEGGSTLLNSFLKAGYWDEIIKVTNPSIQLKEGIAAPQVPGSFKTKHFDLGIDKVTHIFSN